jgi:uncharacterized protein (DUF1697 family)
MAELKEIAQELGFENPVTHLRSGNLVYSTTQKPAAAAAALAAGIEDRFDFSCAVQVRTAAQLKKTVANNPLADVATDPKKLLIAFLTGKPTAAAAKSLGAERFAPEQIAFAGTEAYIWLPNGIHKSKLGTLSWEKTLGLEATSRNMNTVEKLLELAENE